MSLTILTASALPKKQRAATQKPLGTVMVTGLYKKAGVGGVVTEKTYGA